MPTGSFAFTNLRNNKIISHINDGNSDSDVMYLQNVSIANYSLEGEGVNIYYTSNAPSGYATFTQYFYRFDNSIESFSAMYLLNTNALFAGITFNYGSITSTSPAGTIQFTAGFAARFGFYDNRDYTISTASPIYSNFPPITKEPQWFVTRRNGQVTGIIPTKTSSTYHVNYPVYTTPEFGTPKFEIIDQDDNPITQPVAMLETYEKIDKKPDFRSLEASHVYSNLLASRSQHIITSQPSNEYSIQRININDAQIFDGTEDIMIIAHNIFSLDTGYFVDDAFHISNTGTPLLDNDTNYRRFIITSYNSTDYVAIPVSTGFEFTYLGSHLESEVPKLIQYPSGMPFSIVGATVSIPATPPMLASVIIPPKGPAGIAQIKTLQDSAYITNTAFLSSTTYRITGASGKMISFFTRHNQWIELMNSPVMNLFEEGQFLSLKNQYDTVRGLPFDQQAPHTYELKFRSDAFRFANGTSTHSIWRKNPNSLADHEISLYSYDIAGNVIRKLTPYEYSVLFAFR